MGKIEITDKTKEKIEVIGKAQRRIEPEEFAKALGAEIMTEEEAADWLRKHGSPYIPWSK